MLGRPRLSTRRKSGFVAADIGSARVHLLELSRGSRLRVSGYANAAVPASAVADDRIADPDAVGTAIASALKKSSVSSRRAAVAVSGPAVISKVIELPAAYGDAEIEEQIRYDAEAYIPHPIEEVNLDFRVLGRDPNNPDVNRIQLAVCRRDTVVTYLDALAKAGLEPAFVDLESAALENACTLLIDAGSSTEDRVNTAVFDVRFDQTRLTVHQGADSVYTRELALGSRALAERLMQAHEAADAAALFARLRAGELDAADVGAEVADFAATAAGQIEQALQFFLSAAAYDETVAQVVVVGDLALFPGMADALRGELKHPLSFANPIADFALAGGAKRNHVEWEGPGLAIASGLALRAVR